MFLQLNHLHKKFGDKVVVDDLSLSLEQGQLLCILGSSGCGKTTTLNMIGGFLEPDSGTIRLDGQDITNIPPEYRPVSTVFQAYSLFPHMSVLENVIYGLKFQKIKKESGETLIEGTYEKNVKTGLWTYKCKNGSFKYNYRTRNRI